MNTSENIHIQFDCDADDAEVDWRRLETLVRGICDEFEVTDADIEISVVDDEGITSVHQQFLGNNSTTDVISFDLSDEFEDRRNFQYVVNLDMAARQAIDRGHSTEAELALYITHGMLHNLGFDDADEQQSRAMHEKEDEILNKNGFGTIYHHDKGDV
ncbi:MAG: rRNA maturation RNase YbeY [Planctomycetota bacterium]|jgi:probable rRNA maturation factor